MAWCEDDEREISRQQMSHYLEHTNMQPRKDEVDCDAFEQSSVSEHYLCSKDNKYLILKDKQLRARSLTQRELSSPDCRFFIHTFIDHKGTEPGTPIMLYAKQDGGKMVVCCEDDGYELNLQRMVSIPERIYSTTHEAMFILKGLPQSNVYMFKSTMQPDKYLGFESTDGNMKKLVLCEVTDEAECTEIMLLDIL